MIAATPKKLRSGAWGAWVPAPETVTEGTTIRITTRSGKSWDATVTRVVWSGDAGTIVATESQDRPRSQDRPSSYRRRRRRPYVPCGYPGCSPDYCDQCEGEGMYGDD